MASIVVIVGGLVVTGIGLLFTLRHDLLARMGYDRARSKSMRPPWLRFMEIPIQAVMITIGLGWIVLGLAALW